MGRTERKGRPCLGDDGEDSVVAAAGMVVCLSVWAFVFTFYCCGTEVDPRTFYIVDKHTWKNF